MLLNCVVTLQRGVVLLTSADRAAMGLLRAERCRSWGRPSDARGGVCVRGPRVPVTWRLPGGHRGAGRGAWSIGRPRATGLTKPRQIERLPKALPRWPPTLLDQDRHTTGGQLGDPFC
jgi:hypothetical protein